MVLLRILPAMEFGYTFSSSLALTKPLLNTATNHLFPKALPGARSVRWNLRHPCYDNRSAATTVPKAAESSLSLKERAALMSTELKGTSIFLIGINNSIKSNVGKILSEALRYYYFDSEVLVEEASGGKVTAKLLTEADEEFRHLETEVLKQLSSMGRLVVCAGSGSVQNAANLALFRHGISIWIDVPLDMVAKEVTEDIIQPTTSEVTMSGSHSQVLTQLTTLYEECRAGFTTADSSISINRVANGLGYEDVDAVTAEDMVMEILKEIEKLTRVKKMLEEAARPF